MSVIIEPRAAADLDRAEDKLIAVSAAVARLFVRRTTETFDLLEAFPTLGAEYEPPVSECPGLREFGVRRFPSYVVYYQPTPGGITVVRVLPAARGPSTAADFT